MLLTDFVLHKSFTSSEFDGVTAIEIGAGTGDGWLIHRESYFLSAPYISIMYTVTVWIVSKLNYIPVFIQCLPGLVGLAQAQVARRIFITGT
jgi:hypothetical protein